ncbi:MAG TPA: C2 family cysteine protease [Oculatellaceae cyanobacterium]
MALEKLDRFEKNDVHSSPAESGLTAIVQECWSRPFLPNKPLDLAAKSISSLDLSGDIYSGFSKLASEASSRVEEIGKDISGLLHRSSELLKQAEPLAREVGMLPGLLNPHPSDSPHSSDKPVAGAEHPAKTADRGKHEHPFTPKDIVKAGGDSAIRQSHFGDCWFEGPLGGMARTPGGREQICNMIEKNGNGYKVTFPGDPKHPVQVSESEIRQDHLKNTGALAVVEAALIKKDPEHALHGGSKAEAIRLLTGKHATVLDHSKLSSDELGEKMHDSLKHGGIVVASTAKKAAAFAGRTDVASKSEALVPGHVYEVVDCDGKNVTIRNTWGHNRGTAVGEGREFDGVTPLPDGKLKMSVETFKRKFQTTDTSAV